MHGKSPSAPRNKPEEDPVLTVQHKSKVRQAQAPVTTVQAKSKVRQAQAVVSPVKFCPQCGCNVEVIAAALSFFA